MSASNDITTLLHRWMAGDESARTRLFEATYDQLRDMAEGMLRFERQRYVVHPTELVNECAIRLFGLKEMNWNDRSHFLAIAATTMRRALVDEARRRRAGKRDGVEITLKTGHLDGQQDLDLVEVDTALDQLASVSDELARIVELKYFGGLTNQEVSQVMGTSEATVKRQWRTARAWLYDELTGS